MVLLRTSSLDVWHIVCVYLSGEGEHACGGCVCVSLCVTVYYYMVLCVVARILVTRFRCIDNLGHQCCSEQPYAMCNNFVCLANLPNICG